MPTPDPIALPELPANLATLLARVYADAYQAGHDATVEGEFIDLHPNDRDTYWLDHLREHPDVKAYGLTPAPQVPEGMAVNAERYLYLRNIAHPDSESGLAVSFSSQNDWGKWCSEYPTGEELDRMVDAERSAAPSTSPLNEVLGQPEEFNLNEVSGNSGQLASLEQRARTLPVVPQAFFDEFGESADDRVMDYGQACYDAALTREAPTEGVRGGWQPIESAPKDGRYILVSNSHGEWVAKYHPVYQSRYRPSNPWASMMLNHDHIDKPGRYDKPTHWRELKAPTITPGMSTGEAGLGDYRDKALAWDAVCVALNMYCPGWANNSAKTGLQSAVDAIVALTTQPPHQARREVEQRAREDELPPGFVWLTASAAHRSDAAANIRQLAEDVGAYDEPAGIVPTPNQARLLADIADALEADALFHRTAALSAQPRGVVDLFSADYVLPCDVLVRPATTIRKGCTLRTLMQSIRLREGEAPFPNADYQALSELLNPQPREVRGVDVESMLKACVPGGDIVDPQLVADNIRSWFATTPQDAAGVEAKAAWWEVRRESDPSFPRVFKTEEEADRVLAFVTVNPGPTKHPLYTTPPPGVDVGKLRELRSLLVGIRPEFGQPGSRDVDVRAQQNRIDAAIALIDGSLEGSA